MRRILTLTLLVALLPAAAAAQGDARNLAAEVVDRWNARGTVRVFGAYDLAAGTEVAGTVAVLNGPVTISGRVRGDLIAINADVRLERTARVDGSVLIAGGSLRRMGEPAVGGDVRTQLELVQYTLDGEMMELAQGMGDWRPRLGQPRDQREAYTDLLWLAARTYNRVEGLPILLGPRFRRPTPWGRVEVEALGIARTADPIRWDRGTLGHDARAEVRVGVDYGIVFGGRLFDVIQPVEQWKLHEAEAGLSTFVLHSDLRDHYGRHGAEGTIGGRIGEEVSLHVVFGTERWRHVDARRPLSILKDRDPWRVNPEMDQGTVDLLGLRLNVDTRERLRAPWTGGWFLRADLERGRGTIARATGDPLITPVPEVVNYTRGFIDARRYNTISPGTALNLRLVLGGQLGGDQLPLQRRFSVGGPGSVDGYDFRRAPFDDDVFTCGGIAEREGRPAMCDRMAQAQVELRQDFHVDWVRSDRGDEWWRPGFNGRGQWVLFADAARGWRVGGGDPAVRQDRGLPPLSSFRTSLGTGVDFGPIGFYIAKSVTTAKEPLNFLVRLGRRF